MDSSQFISNLNELILKYNYINGELKLGSLKDNFFNYNINNYEKFYNFLGNKYKKTVSESKIYYYYNMFLISKNENSHVCFQYNNLHMNYFTPIKNKYSLRFRNNDFNKIDTIYFPTLEKYDNEEHNKIVTFEVKYKNSIIYVNFININENINRIIFKFYIDKNNIHNFKQNLSFILSKFYFEKVTFN